MKVKVNGIEREAQIFPAPKGAFCYPTSYPIFPLFCMICEAKTERERACGNVVTCGIINGNGGYETADVYSIVDTVTGNHLKEMREEAIEEGFFDDGKEDEQWKGHLVDIVNAFIQHGTHFAPSASPYIEQELGIRFDWRHPDFIGGTAETVDEEVPEMRRLLKTRLADLGFSVRALNCLKSAEVETVGDLVSRTRRDLLGIRNIGRRTMGEIDDFLIEHRFSYGMDVSKYMNE